MPRFNANLTTQLHVGACYPDEVTVASLGVRLRVREATSSQVSELLIPPCLIRCH